MKGLIKYINTMYKPSFYALIAALTTVSITLALFAVNLRYEMLDGVYNLIYYSHDILFEITLRLFILILASILVDLNERRKKN